MPARSTDDVLADPIRLRRAGDVETDLARNYAPEVVLLCQFGVFRGRAEVRAAAARIGLRLSESRFVFLAAHVAGELAFVEWAAEADGARQLDGADSYVIRDGLIRGQTMSFVLVSLSSCRRRRRAMSKAQFLQGRDEEQRGGPRSHRGGDRDEPGSPNGRRPR